MVQFKDGGFSVIGGAAIVKVLFTALALLISFNLACETSAVKGESAAAEPVPTASLINDYNLNQPLSVPVEQSNPSQFEAQNERFRIAPEGFKQVDFENFSYPYQFPHNGKEINFTLKNGEYEVDFADDRGWFSFSDVFYVDLTDDEKPEAIVILWHVSCEASCDGGAGLFYVYTSGQSTLKPLWQFETGSLGYGCGLKSFSVKDKKITMQLFSRCFDEKAVSPAMEKFQVKDATLLTFGFNGKTFVEEKKEFISVPARNVQNYRAEISIGE